jgi:hypothetical protein
MSASGRFGRARAGQAQEWNRDLIEGGAGAPRKTEQTNFVL